MKRTIIIIVIVAALAVGGYFGLQALRKNQVKAAADQYQTIVVKTGELSASVGGTGTVRANQTAYLAWQTSGIIDELKVGLDDKVQDEQILAALKPDSLLQSMILARADLVTAKRNLENLNKSDVTTATAYQTLVAAQKELSDSKTKRLSKQYTRGSQSTIQLNQADLILAQAEFNNATSNFDLFKDRDDADLMKASALSRLSAAQKALDRAKANLQYVQTMPNDNEIAQADARIQVAEARLKDAQREWDRVKDGPNADDIAAAVARIEAIETTLAQSNLKAPFSGTITEVKSKVGDQVSPGTVTYRLDDLSHMLVDVQITEVDINRIKVGQPATLSFDAIQGVEYKGVVAEVGRVGTSVQGVVNFNVTIEILQPDAQVRPGMTAAVTIATDQLKGVLLVPNRAVRLRNGKYNVYLLTNGVPTAIPITLGLTSDENSEVVTGLKEGDVLVLNPPVEFQSSGGPPSRGGFSGGNN